jgi:FkbM family methyltransferase
LVQIKNMPSFLENLSKGIIHRSKQLFFRPYSIFNISWFREKALKHETGYALKSHIYQGKYKIVFRDGPVFLLSVNELFVNEYYKFKADKERPRIIDCGSYIGTSILYFKVNYPKAIISGFEPDEANYSILKTNLDNWNFSDTKVENAAIWKENGNISFNSAGNMSSRIDTADSVINKKNVKCIRLKDLLVEEIDFLKIDIEGAEFAVLKDCEDNLKNVKNLFVEYHGIYNELYKLNEILEILLRNGFKYYIKEGVSVYAKPFWEKERKAEYDMLLNISAFRD